MEGARGVVEWGQGQFMLVFDSFSISENHDMSIVQHFDGENDEETMKKRLAQMGNGFEVNIRQPMRPEIK